MKEDLKQTKFKKNVLMVWFSAFGIPLPPSFPLVKREEKGNYWGKSNPRCFYFIFRFT